MVEYLKQFDTVLTILLGWLLGLLTPGIAERIRRPYRRRDLMVAVIDELIGLQYTMATFAYSIRTRYSDVSDAFLDQMLPIVEGHSGPDRSEDFIRALKGLRSLPQVQRAAMHQNMRVPDMGITLQQYDIPLFATQIADLAICKVDFQRAVLHIRFHLSLFNRLVPYVQSLFEKTYDNPTPENRARLIANQERTYRDAGKRAEFIVQAIRDLRERYASK